MKKTKEIWKGIAGHENYEVSNTGRIRSLFKKRYRILSHCFDLRGYPMISFYAKPKSKTRRVHRLVAEAFIKKVKGKTFINHKDSNKNNNNVNNLEWVTNQENMTHFYKNGGIKKNWILKSSDYEKIREAQLALKSNRKVAKIFGISHSTVSDIVNGKVAKYSKYRIK